MEYLKQTVKSKKAQKCAKHDIDIINANAERFNKEAEKNLLFQDIL